MRYGLSFLALLLALSVGTAQVDAQGRGKGQTKRPTTAGAKQGGAKAGHAAPKATKAPKSASTRGAATKTTKKATPTTTGTEARAKGNPKKTPTTTTTAVVTDVTPTTPTTVHVKNPKLEARLMAMLPNLPAGTTVQDASAGFKNWGQFVAAVHVSNNLGIDFTQLKTAMTGLTPSTIPGQPPVQTAAPMSLGQAIQAVTGGTTTPDGTVVTPSTITTEVKKAETAANTDLRRTRGGN